jgi:uncharacterized repeat protein (TIGR02543 family)
MRVLTGENFFRRLLMMKKQMKNRRTPGVAAGRRALLGCLCLAAVFAAGCRAIAGEDKDKFIDPPVLKGFPLTAHNAVLFKDKGPIMVSATLDPEFEEKSLISWEIIEGDDVIEIESVEGESFITIKPKEEGTARVKATVTPKEGYTFAEGSELVSECYVTVLDGLTIKPANLELNPSKLLFFTGEPESRKVEIDLGTQELGELSRVANFTWTIEGGNAAEIPAESAGADVMVSAASAPGTVTLRMTLEARNALESGDAPDFNGDGVSAILALDVQAAPALSIDAPDTVMLNTGNTEKELDIKLNYPNALFGYNPTVVWSSSDEGKASVEGATAAEGVANAVLTAKNTGVATISAALSVEGRQFQAQARGVTVTQYVEPDYSVQKITLTGVQAGGVMQITQTDTSAEITATAGRNDAVEPSNKKINWSASPAGFVNIINSVTPNPDNAKIKITAVTPTTGQNVTITATSDSNNTVTATFTVKVNALTVTITANPTSAAFTYNTGVTLSAVTNAANQAVTWSTASNLANIGAGSTPLITAKDAVIASTNLVIKAASVAAPSAFAEKTVVVNPHKFNITFKSNYAGGPADKAQNNITYGSSTTLTKNTFTRTDYKFEGWTVAENGSGTVLNDEAAVSLLNSNTAAKTANGTVSLYAKWSSLLYSVKYNINGGTVGSGGQAAPYTDSSWLYGTTKALKTVDTLKWTKSGSLFKGWDTASAGSTVVHTDGKSVLNLTAAGGTANLYAVWQEIQSVDSITVTPGADSACLPTLKVNDTASLEAAVVVTGSITNAVSWSSSNPSAVEVVSSDAASCVIKAKANGTAKIKALSDFDSETFAEYQVKAFTADAAGALATGGSVSIVKIVNGSEVYFEELHTFTGSGSFAWKDGVQHPATGRLLVVGGGGGGGGGSDYYDSMNTMGNGGNGGNVVYNATFTLPDGSTGVTVGGGGGGGAAARNGSAGGGSAFGGVSAGGGGGGTGERNNSNDGSNGSGSGSYDISGSSQSYGMGGARKASSGNPSAGGNNTGKGGQSGYMQGGANGGSGIVIVRFRFQ